MEAIWKNPEFIRHFRRELRPARLAVSLVLPVLLCLLVMLVMRQGEKDNHGIIHWKDYWGDLYIGLLVVQGLVLAAWCASTCGQAISSERQLKTFDFLRTTRLTSGELLAGSVLGRPLMGFLMVGITLPLTLLAGTAAGHPWRVVLGSVAVLLVVCLTFAIGGILFSLLTLKPRVGEFIALILVFLWFSTFVGRDMKFAPWGTAIPAIGVVPALVQLNGAESGFLGETNFFRWQIPPALFTVISYATISAWFWLMLVRNLKRDREDLRLLSRWQAMIFLIYVNVMFLAQSRLQLTTVVFGWVNPQFSNAELLRRQLDGTISAYVLLNGIVFYLIGLTMLAPVGSLKTWFRARKMRFQRYWEENSPPITWMVVAGVVAWLVVALFALAYRRSVPLADWSLGWLALRLGVLLIYAMRDVLFLQWCSVTRMKSPLVKGTLLLALYYFVACMSAALIQAAAAHPDSDVGYAFVTPIGAIQNQDLLPSLQGAGIQIGIMILIMFMIRNRFTRTADVAVAA